MNPSTYKKYRAAEKYFESLGGSIRTNKNKLFFNTDFSLSRMRLLLQLTGNPDRAFKIIHIAGTSGKGSVTNYLYNILQANGCKTGAHFSPFVSVATEKIQINNKFISVKEFIKLVDDLKPIIDQCSQTISSPSYFEVWILAALVYFKKKNCDYVVLETGCGGRFDATNAVQKTIVSVITNIGLDHTAIIGKTISKIAYEKAGIIRENGVVFTAANRKQALAVIKKVCLKQNAKLITVKNKTNADLASAVARYLKINEQDITQGLMNAKLPARFEIVQQNPLIILDGAHNPDKLNYLTKRLRLFKQEFVIKKTHLICSLTEEKNIKQCFKKIIKEVDFVYCTRALTPVRSFARPEQLAKTSRELKNIPTQFFSNPHLAFRTALNKTNKNDLIIITGSFFLCGDLRSHWIDPKKQLEQRTNFPK